MTLGEITRLREAGWSFTAIGQHYGVSKQAAHQMYWKGQAKMADETPVTRRGLNRAEKGWREAEVTY